LPRRVQHRGGRGRGRELRGAARGTHQRRQRRNHPVGCRRRPYPGAHPPARGRRGRRGPAPGRVPHPAMNTNPRTPPMTSPLRSIAAAALLALASATAAAVEPFTADYAAQYMGMQATGRMTLEPAGGNRWKYSLQVSGAGARLEQNTVFEAEGEQWRPVSSHDSQRGESGLAAMLVKPRSTTATYDWSRGQATWDGDVKQDRRGPVRLQPGDVDGMLMNL